MSPTRKVKVPTIPLSTLMEHANAPMTLIERFDWIAEFHLRGWRKLTAHTAAGFESYAIEEDDPEVVVFKLDWALFMDRLVNSVNP